jgi:phage terminase Nu1 subunit (DNA packaging protein)
MPTMTGVVDRELGHTRGRAVDQGELALLFGVDIESVRLWQQEGMPFVPRAAIGAENGYDSAQCLTWLIRREIRKAAGGETAKDRLARLQADKVELEILEKRGQLVPLEDIEPAWLRIATAVRSQLLDLPAKLAPLLEATPGAEAKRALLVEEVERVLSNLSHHG